MNFKKLIFIALLFVVYFLFYYMWTYEIRISLSITACVITVIVVLRLFYILYTHEQVKEYFWNNLKTEDTSLVNYIFHRPAIDPQWKYETEFQENRNIVIIKCNKEKANLLISLEKLSCYLEVLIFFLINTTILSFYYA